MLTKATRGLRAPVMGVSLWLVLGVALAGCDTSDRAPLVSLPIEAPGSAGQVPALWRPRGLTAGPDGVWYIAEAASGRVRAFDPATGALAVVFDVADRGQDAEALGVSLSPRWGQALLYVEQGWLLLHTPGQRPALVPTAGGQAQPLGQRPGQGRPPSPGVRLEEVDLSGLSGVDLVDQPGGDLILGLSNQLWQATRAPGQPLSQATLTPRAGDGSRGPTPPTADALTSPLDLPDWCGLAAHPSGGAFWVDAAKTLRYLTPSGRILRVTGHGFERGGDAVGIPLADFGLLPAAVNLARWHAADQALYLMDSSHILRVTLSLDADGELTDPPQGRVTRVAFRAPESGGLIFDGGGSGAGDLVVTLGFSGSLARIARDGSETYTALYGLHPVDAALNQLNTDRYNLSPDEPYKSRHAPFALRAPLLPQALALWGGDLILSLPAARGLLTSPALAAGEAGPWPVQELFYNARSEAVGWPFLAHDLSRPERLYVSDLNSLQAWAVNNDGLLGLTVFNLYAPPPNGIPGPALNARLTSPATLRLTDSLTLLLDPARALLLGVNAAGVIDTYMGISRAPLMQRGERAGFSVDIGGATAWGVTARGALRAFALPIPADWTPPPASPSDASALTLIADATAVTLGGVSVPTRAAAHVCGGGVEPLRDDIAALDARLPVVSALHLREAPAGAADVAALTFAAPDPDAATPRSRIAYLTADAAAPNEGRRLRLLPDAACGDAPPDLGALYVLNPLDPLADTASLDLPTALIAWSTQTLAVYGCATEPGWRVGDGALSLNVWTPLAGEVTSTLPPAYAPDAASPQLLIADGGQARLLAVASPAQAPPPEPSRAFDAPDLALWSAWAISPDGASLTAQRAADDPANGFILVNAPFTTSPLVAARVAGGGEGIGDGARVADVTPGEALSGLTVASDGDLYAAFRDTQTLWHLPTKRLDTPGAVDLARLLAHGEPLFPAATAGEPVVTPLAPSEEGVYVALGGEVVHVHRETRARARVAGGGDAPPTAGVRATDAALDPIQGLATLNGHLYILTRAGLFDLAPDGALYPIHDTDGALTLEDGRRVTLNADFYGQPPMIIAPPSSLLLLYPQLHGVARVSLPILGVPSKAP
jgi:hypothetical protein